MQNRIDATISVADRDKILDFISQIRALMPFLIDLSPEERQALPKMGDKSRAFVSQALQLADQDDSYSVDNYEESPVVKILFSGLALNLFATAIYEAVRTLSESYRNCLLVSLLEALEDYKKHVQNDRDKTKYQNCINKLIGYKETILGAPRETREKAINIVIEDFHGEIQDSDSPDEILMTSPPQPSPPQN